MDHLAKLNRLSSFFMEKKNHEVDEFFKEMQEKAKQVLGLPDDITLAGFTFDHSNNQLDFTCKKMCPEVINGKVHFFCCS